MSIISVKQALYYGINELKKSKISLPRLDVEILLGFVLGFSREKLLSNPQYPISNLQYLKFKKLISQRTNNWSVAYLVGSKEFYGIDFYVNENILIPRPETELLVEEVIKETKKQENNKTTILEIGTGSGCISLTLAKHLPKAKITATDISEKALAVARKNQNKLKVKNVKLKKSNLLSNIKIKPDIIVANLPYLTKNELKQKSILREPKLALYGGRNGTEIYEKLFQQIQSKKWDDTVLFLEIGEKQAKKFQKLVQKYFSNSKIEIKKDLAKRDRLVIIRKLI